ncbi:MAG: hypothetical protein DCF25_22065, partial [Leptolyngbya foveolarum]
SGFQSLTYQAISANEIALELKGAFASSKIDRVTAEYESRKASGQKYIGLVAHADSDKLYLFQPPQPGYFHSRVLTVKADLPPVDTLKGINAETSHSQEVQQGEPEKGDSSRHPSSPIVTQRETSRHPA